MNIVSFLKVGIVKFCYYLYTPINKLHLMLNGVKIGKSSKIRGVISVFNPYGKVIIGDGFVCNSASWANPIGFDNKTRIQIHRSGELYIGNCVSGSNFSVTCSDRITIGNHVMIGAGCKIYDTDFHAINPDERYGEHRSYKAIKTKPIIEDGAFLGAGVIVLKGSRIGKNSVVGAGSVVAGEIPDGEIWAGNPVRYIRKV